MQLTNQRFAIAAGETKRFEMAGRYFEVIESAAAIDVYFSDQSGGRAGGMRNALSGFYANSPFSTVEIYSATAQTIEMLITDGTGGTRRQPGVVQVVDSTRQLVMAGLKFGNTATVATPGAGQYAQAQLWNGTANKGLAVAGIYVFQSDLAGYVAVLGNSVRLPAPSTAVQVISKKMLASGYTLAPANIETVRKADATAAGAAGVASPLGAALANIYASAGNQQARLPLDDGPFVLGPGAGLVLAHATAQSGMVVYFEGEIFDWYG